MVQTHTPLSNMSLNDYKLEATPENLKQVKALRCRYEIITLSQK